MAIALRGDRALTGQQCAAVIDDQGTCAGAVVAEGQCVVERETAVIEQAYGLPVHVLRATVYLAFFEHQAIAAGAPIQVSDQCLRVETDDISLVVTWPHSYRAADAPARPGKNVVIVAGTYLTFERATTEGDLV
ncbi:hypothetical protein LD001_20475 [Pseudomonas kurunegalensis]|uniref:hypothetical protein n=1 Tax=Pseudomonas kurunegalensis TaxID=485880 RepID=UPI001CDBEB93|nr:hypothetical protein [Pseudomonas kurunegalensis]MCA4077656.1 hypothetical protein [Pseudomonas kurunegalensis]